MNAAENFGCLCMWIEKKISSDCKIYFGKS